MRQLLSWFRKESFCGGGGRAGAAVPPAPSDVPSCPQGYLPTTPGSTTSTVEMSPGTLPIPSLSLAAAQSAGMSQVWGWPPEASGDTHTQNLIKAGALRWVGLDVGQAVVGKHGFSCPGLDMCHRAAGVALFPGELSALDPLAPREREAVGPTVSHPRFSRRWWQAAFPGRGCVRCGAGEP